MTEIELVKQEIKMLQSKLSFLEELEKTKTPVEEAYKDWWGQYPELETDSEYDDMRWRGFQAGFQAAYEEKVREDDYYNEVKCDEKDNPKPMDDVVNRLVKKYQAQKLYNMIRDELDYLGYDVDCCDAIVSVVENWILDEQSSEGSQNVNTELLVEGFNDAIRKMKEMLR
jgi:hypothetical protein